MFNNKTLLKEGSLGNMKTIINKQHGAVSLFIVVFATLLITIISVGFVGIMVQDQQQASTADLSQSAYDSAQAGVEDAKRALLRFQSFCAGGGDCSIGSTEYQNITSTSCNDSVSSLTDIDASGDEVKIQTGGENALDQAYTCVKVKLNTTDYLGTLSASESKIIPLKGVSDFNTIQIEWFSSKDISANNSVVNLQTDGQTPLLQSWPINRPSIIQAQLIQFGGNGFSLSDLDSAQSSDTLFLYPSTVGVSPISFLNDSHLMATGKPQLVKCSSSLQTDNYACSIQITLPAPANGGTSRTAYLRLAALYNSSSFRVVLLNNTEPVEFDAVQPEIDSTGRTNDLFRRVQARVELTDTNFPFPSSAIYLSGNFCKDFVVTNNASDYVNSCSI